MKKLVDKSPEYIFRIVSNNFFLSKNFHSEKLFRSIAELGSVGYVPPANSNEQSKQCVQPLLYY